MATSLGLSFFYHDSAAALVRDGQIVAAAAEERFCRRKHTNEFPKLAIEYCLEAANLRSINDLDVVVFYEKPVTKLFRVMETMVQTWPWNLANFTQRFPHYLTKKFNVYREIERHLVNYRGPILFTEHHLSHAASAFLCSPFDEAAILTVDGVGERETTTIGVGSGRDIRLEKALHFPHSLGLLYSALTSYLGFQVNDGEWKVMGLAPYGKPRFVDQFRQLVDFKPDGSFRLNMDYFVHHWSSRWSANHARWERLFGFPRRSSKEEIAQHHEDLACSGQAVVEQMILGLAREARKISGSPNLVIGGGVGLNSVANWRIEEQGIFDNVWIQPAAGDDGGALGAALYASQCLLQDPPAAEMKHAYYGPEFSQEEVQDYLQYQGIEYRSFDDDDLVEEVADLIAAGQVVGWCRGRMEFGPRALGARSILADATNPEMKSIINRKIKFREYFRPFAPAVPLDEVHEYFDVAPGTELPFMLKVPKVRADKREAIPAVTHEDGTGRVQTVTEEINPLYYRLLKAMLPRRNASVLLNTSFNIRGEPIVCTPDDAYRCFLNTDIDALVLGNCLVTKTPAAQIDVQRGHALSDALEAAIGQESMATATLVRPKVAALPVAETSTVGERVLSFYKQLPFNYYSNALDMARDLMAVNAVAEYPPLYKYLRERPESRVLDVGCGAGWFVNSCTNFHGSVITGIDLNPVALKQARAVSRFVKGGERATFLQSDVFDFDPSDTFDVVNSLGVLHHTHDCHAAIRQALKWVAPGGYLHLGLYHLYGRRPFLQHFAKIRAAGGSEEDQYREFARLNPSITDETHLTSWFRDQVLHPFETQHTFAEIAGLLEEEGFGIEATSINRFKRMPEMTKLFAMEKEYEALSERALNRRGKYFPGFFVVWARKH